jgi:hypothetical protein
MRKFKVIVFLLAGILLVAGCGDDEHHEDDGHNHAEPSAGAKDMPGAKGIMEYKPTDWQQGETTWWKDTDGIAPGIAGCHIGTDASGQPNGRMFPEACLENGLLVESNPQKDELHSHTNDIGHPDTFDCNAWCIGQGNKKGMCVAASAAPCKQPSALCACQ